LWSGSAAPEETVITEATMAANASGTHEAHAGPRPKLDVGFDARTAVMFFSVLALALFFIAYNIYVDVNETGVRTTNVLPYLLLGVALFVALGFEFVNGFHDTANAVARWPRCGICSWPGVEQCRRRFCSPGVCSGCSPRCSEENRGSHDPANDAP
jgi:hypothetical protein